MLWDWQQNKIIRKFEGHTNNIWRLLKIDDYLLSCGKDKLII